MNREAEVDTRAAPITVSQLNRQVKALLEQGLGRLWVEGEISNLARPASGHIYFSLKDDAAQVRAAWFRQRQRGPAIGLKDGDKVLVFARVSVYEPRGEYQLIVERIEPAGEGALRACSPRSTSRRCRPCPDGSASSRRRAAPRFATFSSCSADAFHRCPW